MAKFNKATAQPPRLVGALQTERQASGLTGNGAPGFAYDQKSELFLLATTSFFGEDSFYEGKDERARRFIGLIYKIVESGDVDWLARFLEWLRSSANIRTGAIVGAIEAARAMRDRKLEGGRQIVASVLQRADEPGEALAYFMNNYGRKIPKPIKRGIADAASRLYTERNALKYDTVSKGLRFGDVLELVHAKPQIMNGRFDSLDVGRINQDHLFKWLIDRRHNREDSAAVATGQLPMILTNKTIRERAVTDPSILLNADALAKAGMTWEDVLSLGGKRLDKAKMWEAIIPSMGYMALLRNLRNFSESGISGQAVTQVIGKLIDAKEIKRSRQLPMRFLSAYNATKHDLKWGYPLEVALEASLDNVPTFAGRTLILIDTSGSMADTFSKDGTLKRWDAAVVFGLALSRACPTADVVAFSSHSKVFPKVQGESLLRGVERWQREGFFMGGGTETYNALSQHFRGHDRVVVLTDEQASTYRIPPQSYVYDVTGSRYRGVKANANAGMPIFHMIPDSTPVYTFNLAGYAHGHAPSGTRTRITVGGLSDAAFNMMSTVESSASGWPF